MRRALRDRGGGDWDRVPAKMSSFATLSLPADTAVTAADGSEVRVLVGHASGHLGFLHFGLGAATAVKLRVQWPQGELGMRSKRCELWQAGCFSG